MGIRLKYEPAGAVAGLAAYAGGQNKARERSTNRALDIWQEEQAKKARREELVQRQQFEFGMQGYRESAQQLRDEQRFENQKELFRQRRTLDLEDENRRQTAVRDAEIENDLQSGKLILSPGAQEKIKKLQDDLESKLPTYDESQRAEAIEKANQRIREIKRYGTRHPEPDQLTREEQLRKAFGDAGYEQYGDLPWIVADDGKPTLPPGFKLPESADTKAAEAANARIEYAGQKTEEALDSIQNDDMPTTLSEWLTDGKPDRHKIKAYYEKLYDDLYGGASTTGGGSPGTNPPGDGAGASGNTPIVVGPDNTVQPPAKQVPPEVMAGPPEDAWSQPGDPFLGGQKGPGSPGSPSNPLPFLGDGVLVPGITYRTPSSTAPVSSPAASIIDPLVPIPSQGLDPAAASIPSEGLDPAETLIPTGSTGASKPAPAQAESKGPDFAETFRRLEQEAITMTDGQPTKVLPGGIPQGARWIDENTIQLPNGRRIRRKG